MGTWADLGRGDLCWRRNRYLQMSGMVLGSMIEADSRLRQYEARMRVQRRAAKEQAYWQRIEKELGKDEDE